jgi:hypothetical protein
MSSFQNILNTAKVSINQKVANWLQISDFSMKPVFEWAKQKNMQFLSIIFVDILIQKSIILMRDN